MLTDDILIDSVVKIANSEGVIKTLEPDVSFPQTLTRFQAKRILYALALLLSKWMEVNDGVR